MAEDRNNEHIGPRTPRDIKGLLKFCMEATRNEDAPGTSSFETMPEEVNYVDRNNTEITCLCKFLVFFQITKSIPR